ncbi:hypothetical protein [Pedobacter nyackensis]|uniref:Uncharacterized protein n=1 Tax=Pedobacter nyackensis TaxID=475255 RepID=A0A1W2A164_9SPHI|nr:hypothetical protein [Pedobacter nyackensis]SMC54363.1 hypothetical protein SAMN04488101_101237 [Pedobacter nyackensis]
MAQIPPIDDAYINEIIKSNGPYNPALLTTQGVKFRELIKLLRDRMEQGDSSAVKVTDDQSISGTKTFTLVKAEWISVNNLIETKLLNLNAGSFATQLSSQELSTFRTQILQDKSGVIALTSDIEDLAPYQLRSEKGQSNGYAGLDSGSKLLLANIPDSLLGQVEYSGTWNASTNTPTLVIPSDVSTKGHYYINTAVGTQFGIDFQVGDWIISNGTQWDKVDNTDAVITVFGRLGNILAVDTDYSAYYPLLTGNYVNPTWIESLPYSKITDTPNLSIYELLTNKQNSLMVDGSGVKYPTVDAVNSGLATYLPLIGGTLTGGLNGTTGSFTGKLSWGSGISSANSITSGTTNGTTLKTGTGSVNDLVIVGNAGAILSVPTGTVDVSISGNVTATIFIGDLTGNAATVTDGEVTTNKSGSIFGPDAFTKYPNLQAIRDALATNQTIGANTSGSAAYWGGYFADLSNSVTNLVAPIGLDGLNTVKRIPTADMLMYLGFPTGVIDLQTITDINNTTTNGANFGGGLSWGSGSLELNKGKLYSSFAIGTNLSTKSGSVYDFQLTSPDGSGIFNVPTGTINASFAGNVAAATLTSFGKMSWGSGIASANSIVSGTTNGTTLKTGTGSVNDFTLVGNAGFIMQVPTGTADVAFSGGVSASGGFLDISGTGGVSGNIYQGQFNSFGASSKSASLGYNGLAFNTGGSGHYSAILKSDNILSTDKIFQFGNTAGTVAIKEDIKYGATLVTFDGTATVFNIPHGMGSTPASFSVSFGDAGQLNFVQSVRTLGSTNITFTCTNPPTAGSQTVYWQVFK